MKKNKSTLLIFVACAVMSLAAGIVYGIWERVPDLSITFDYNVFNGGGVGN